MELPSLIYHDELILDGMNPRPTSIGDVNRQGALVCRSETQPQVSWKYTDGNFFPDTNTRIGDIQQIRTDAMSVPSLSRLSRGSEAVSTVGFLKGLFTSRVMVVDDDLERCSC